MNPSESDRSAATGSDDLHETLLERVLGDTSVDGLGVLEIGCGRGGNCRLLRNRGGPARVVGLDLGLANLRFAFEDRAGQAGFSAGSASSLPFADASFDLVLNLESSHCYSRFASFLGEVERVLAPGGLLCWADLWDLDILDLNWTARNAAFDRCGLDLIADEDLSEGVFRSLKHPDGLPQRLRSLADGADKSIFETLAHNMETCSAHLAAGQCSYRLMRWRKR